MFLRYGCHPEHSWPEHTHEQNTILFFPEENSEAEFSWRSPDGQINTVILEGKHACLIARNVIHSLRWKRQAALVCLHVHDELLDQFGPKHEWEGVRVYGWWEIARDDLLTWQLACRLGDICHGRKKPGRTSLHALGVLLAEHLLDMTIRADKAAHPHLLNQQLLRVIEWVDIHFSEKIRVADMAQVVGISCFHFARLFKRTTGHTPYRYLTARRLQRVNELFGQGDMRVSEIAVATGFFDQSHLDGTIRKFCGEKSLRKKNRRKIPKRSKDFQ